MSTKPKRIVKQVTCPKCGKVMYPNWVARHVCGELEKYVKKYTPKPKLVMICPNGWKNCHDCQYISPTNTCLLPKSDIDVLIQAAKIAEEIVTKDAIESAHKIRGTWFEEFSRMSDEERWADYRKYHITDLTYKEPITCMTGPFSLGGGSSNSVKKENKGTKPTVYKWGEFK